MAITQNFKEQALKQIINRREKAEFIAEQIKTELSNKIPEFYNLMNEQKANTTWC